MDSIVLHMRSCSRTLRQNLSCTSIRALKAPGFSPEGAVGRNEDSHHSCRNLHLLSAADLWVRQRRSSAGYRTKAVADSAMDGGGQEGYVEERELHEEASESYLAYAMSVIVGRALPDVRDGLKPVHRRILYAMHELGLQPAKPFRKSARVVGEVLGKYHPHGDSAVYDALVRMAQPFTMSVPLVDGHGNFGSQDDDPAAAMRYTECRLQPISVDTLLDDLSQDTVDFAPTFDSSEMEPVVMPAKLPHLLINGSQGIAVGIATRIPPHNLAEIAAGLQAMIKNPDISLPELLQHIRAPDFPTGGIIMDKDGADLERVYATGRGSLQVRGRVHAEASNGGSKRRKADEKSQLVITEVPYQVNKAVLVEDIARLVEDKTIEGVADVRDESDRNGMRVVLELKRGAAADVVTNVLHQHTKLQSSFPCNMVALVNGTPRQLPLAAALSNFLAFRCEVVRRRAQFQLAAAEKRLHLVQGFLLAMQQVDVVVSIVRKADEAAVASEQLQQKLGVTKVQADSILGMTLRRLTALEARQLADEEAALTATIADRQRLLCSEEEVLRVVDGEVEEMKRRYGAERRTAVSLEASAEMDPEELIPNSQSVVMVSRRGYIKRMKADAFSAQARGGLGSRLTTLKHDDSVEDVILVQDRDRLAVLTNQGRIFVLKAFEIPLATRTASGTRISKLLRLPDDQSVAAVMPTSSSESLDLLLVSIQGQVVRTPLSRFASVRVAGSRAMELEEGDQLLWAGVGSAADDLLIATSQGRVVRFGVSSVRQLAGPGSGVRGVRLHPGDAVVGVIALPHEGSAADLQGSESASDEESEGEGEGDGEEAAAEAEGKEDGDDTARHPPPWLLVVTKQGKGKRTSLHHFRCKRRGGYGQLIVKLAEEDALKSVQLVMDQESEVIIGTAAGRACRIRVAEIGSYAPRTRGMRVQALAENDEVQTVALISASSEDSS